MLIDEPKTAAPLPQVANTALLTRLSCHSSLAEKMDDSNGSQKVHRMDHNVDAMKGRDGEVASSVMEPLATDNPMRRSTVTAVACFFLSGFLALALEICWIRKASLVFGSASFALSTVLAVFFGGLAVGSYLSGRWSQRLRRPLRMYAAVEIGVGALAILSPLTFTVGQLIYGQFYPLLMDHFFILSFVRLLLVTVTLLPPTILMGATLPLFCRQYVETENRIARRIGFLYGINTLGAAVGCATSGFLMIRYIGVDRSIYLCGIMNMLLGWVAWRLPVQAVNPSTDNDRQDFTQSTAPAVDTSPGGVRAVPFLFFLAGFIALGNEVLWTRFLSLMMHNTVYTYTLTLTVILLGIVLGSMLTARWMDHLRRRALFFGALQAAIGITVMTVLMLPASWWEQWRDPKDLSSQLWVVLAILMVPAVLSGISFPLAVRMVVSDPRQASRVVGRMSALNTAGGIAGALSIGFVFLPLLGMQQTLWLTTGLSLLIGIVTWLYVERVTTFRIRSALAIASGVVWLGIPLSLGTRLPADFLTKEGTLIDFREGLSAQVAVIRKKEKLLLEIDRLWQGENQKTHQIMAAHVPMLLHEDPQSVLLVGIGAGQTASRFLMYPSLQTLDCVDIERELSPLIKQYFAGDWLDDSRVNVHVEDGRNYVTHTDTRYDVISVEVGQAFRPGVASFYTTDFYHLAKARLKPGGLISQFAPLSFYSHQMDEFRTVVSSFIQVFPNSILWYNYNECLLIGSTEKQAKLSADRLALLAGNQQIHQDLAFSHWGGSAHWLNQPQNFLAGFLAGPRGLTKFAGNAPVYRDDRPYLEYTTNPHLSAAEMPVLKLIQSCIDPVDVVLSSPPGSSLTEATHSVRTLNLRDIEADFATRGVGRLIAQGDHKQAEAFVRKGLRLNPNRVSLYASLGVTLFYQQKIREAMDSFHHGLELDPDNFDCHMGLANAYMTRKNFQKASFHLQHIVNQNPDFAQSRFLLARAYQRLQQPDQAMEAYRETLRLEPEHAAAHGDLGMMLTRQGKMNEAMSHLRQSIRIDPGVARSHFILAKTLHEVDLTGQAINHFRTAVRLKPDWPLPLNDLAWILATHPDVNLRNPQEALLHAEQAAELTEHQNASFLDTLAVAYAAADLFDQARQTARQAIEIASSDQDSKLADQIQRRLRQYEQGKPHRTPTAAENSSAP